MAQIQPHERVTAAIRNAANSHGIALIPFVTAGYPERSAFIPTLRALAEVADVIEVGVPFSDPMADGVTIQRASRAAIASGVSLRWILAELQKAGELPAPVVLMSYLNPLLALGGERLADAARAAHVGGFIVPDLPLEEAGDLGMHLDARGLGLVQLVTPATPEARVRRLCAASRGFVYAVTSRGVTGGARALPADVPAYLDRVRALSPLPVCAGFGVRSAEQVRALGGHADGVIVGSALVEELEARRDPVAFLEALRSRRH
ncbi:MAG: tryptophan synthase alpha chain [Gammaproteobacteria bacterium]|nr:MAG: tryptophan synthase subunit alpha [Pseudomonadota bacterium]MBC6944905.1 tryptophan synthase subunit alpha [Gammaproteobacteria bacterium]MCE7896811.1 tryptophan synthase subunit alpha [Gammaproteobacteria bacterium PRO8]MDL1879663.1 tryptophan synthase subunit alpha [Gammaproteobacteria bacterium PRO2]MCL4777349.1 tryptophan synthase subunit alpha [Gammaproteobacteria bacterium]